MKYHKTMKLVLILLGVFIFTPKSVMAMSCVVNNHSYSLNVGSIIVQRDVAIGQPISNEFSGSPSLIYTCTAAGVEGISSGVKSYLSYNSTASNGRRIYNTGIPGIGVAIGADPHSCGPTYVGVYYPTIDYTEVCRANTQTGTVYAWNMSPVFQFYKTASSSSGTISAQIAGFMAMNSISWTDLQTEVPITVTGTVTTVACAIKTPNIQVPLIDMPANEFSSIGTIAKPKVFNVGLDCDTGARINAKLTGTQNTDTSADGVLQLTGAGGANVASGVGIQILYNSLPVALNNNVVLKTSAGGQETFPFTAQYYQTKANVTAGAANATATLELTYQ